ncbi:MAG TPA: amidohydrolase family protein [Xanthobacteraceae bacterium]|nr:amidohydrolase family protein [Xanthobacteraceae bacterium]
MADRPRVIALEEHYLDAELRSHFQGADRMGPPPIIKAMEDVGEQRIKAMDEAGVDVQVLSHAAPSTQKLDADSAVAIAKGTNDRLRDICSNHPTRLAGFAALPTAAPEAAADELERCVNKLGFKGAMIHGLTNGEFIDLPKYWPIFARAEALDVPIYLHPALPDEAVVGRYYQDYAKDFPGILTAGWGFTVETATAGIRMVLSGVFKKHPKLKIILGHLGEGLPFLLWRMDQTFSRDGRVDFRHEFSSHFYLTTSGNFSNPALLCSVMEMGIDRILFSVDYPFVDQKPATEWMKTVPLCQEDRVKILSGNAEKLLKM